MYYYEVAPNRIVRAESDTFTYHSDLELTPGHLVLIDIGNKTNIGVVVSKVKKPAYQTKQIIDTIEDIPLPKELVHLSLWLSNYYKTPLAIVLQTVLPSGIAKKRRSRIASASVPVRNRTNFVLNPDQSIAVKRIDTMSPGSVILHGVTGSGKTAVYIELAKRALAAKRSVLVLVPEIALTGQVVDEFRQHFDTIVLTHSRQTEAERHAVWKSVLARSEPQVIIGPRSALFMPVRGLGLVIIDEFHEPSFKQEQAPRYSALRAASILAKEHAAKLILGSATPPIVDYYLAKSSRRPIIQMLKPAQRATKPVIEIVDMTKRHHFKTHRFLSDKLLRSLTETFAKNKQALIFHNRRGSASVTLCEECGWQAGCPRCYIPLALHSDHHQLRCHICGFSDRVPTSCPVCGNTSIIHKGIGTKLIESELQKLFPDRRIARFDGDSKQIDSLESRYSDIYKGAIDLIIGTQIVAKGLDLPHLRTVGVVQADAGLSLPDYASAERTFQLLTQVTGRVGRSHHQTNVVIQSYQPSHPAVQFGLNRDYAGFYTYEIQRRKLAHFPPFTFLLKLTCIYKTEAAAIRNAHALANSLKTQFSGKITILGPVPAFYERQRDTYRWQLVIKSPQRATLIEVLRFVPSAHWQTELDPASLL